MQETFLSTVDRQKLQETLDTTKLNVELFNNMCSEIAKEYTEGLDNLMGDIYVDCVQNKNTSNEQLENYYLELVNMIYYLNEKLEQLGVYSDMSDSAYKEVYSKSILNNKLTDSLKKPTQKDLDAHAELESQYEKTVAYIYNHAYKLIKSKLDTADSMCNCMRKILTVRTSEMSMSNGGIKQNDGVRF